MEQEIQLEKMLNGLVKIQARVRGILTRLRMAPKLEEIRLALKQKTANTKRKLLQSHNFLQHSSSETSQQFSTTKKF